MKSPLKSTIIVKHSFEKLCKLSRSNEAFYVRPQGIRSLSVRSGAARPQEPQGVASAWAGALLLGLPV